MSALRLVAGPGGTYGNTVESFLAAAEGGADTIEIDVIRPPGAHPRRRDASLIAAHDWEDARRRPPLPLTEALDAFLAPPLLAMEINLDIKLPGREEELVEALCERGLIDRAMISTLELYSLRRVGEIEPKLRRGWSYPKASRDWTSVAWARLPLRAALAAMRFTLPGLAAKRLPELDVDAMWVYHPLITVRLGRICRHAGVELIAWKIDDEARMRDVLNAGATGICSNTPHVFRRIRP
jgi:glycerophosphoryl diester phosphodiesterase